MAEEGHAKDKQLEDALLALLALALVGQILQQLPIFIEEKFGITLVEPTPERVLIAEAMVDTDTPLGTKVTVPTGASWYAAPEGGTQAAGRFAPGRELVLRGGPETDAAGEVWWYVEDPMTGTIGWVRQDTLVRSGVGGIDRGTGIGTRVRALVTTPVWDAPGGNEVSSMVTGAWGELVDGPEVYSRVRWWYIDREESTADGWVPEATLTLSSEKNWRAGAVVQAVRTLDLYERAGGGAVVGALLEEEEADVVSDPTYVGGAYWWELETSRGEVGWAPESALVAGGVRGALGTALTVLVVIGALITVILLAGILYVTFRTNQIRGKEARRIRELTAQAKAPVENERWDKVLAHVSGDNPNDWRLAIIEADIMLDEVVSRIGYTGTTLGERLKQVRKGDLHSIDAAWEAHKIRNQIAHEGGDFILTQREARRVVELYGEVFRELHYI